MTTLQTRLSNVDSIAAMLLSRADASTLAAWSCALVCGNDHDVRRTQAALIASVLDNVGHSAYAFNMVMCSIALVNHVLADSPAQLPYGLKGN